MKIPLEEHLPYRLLALVVLVFFYIIYLLKMWAQKRQGICTQQIDRQKEPSIHRVEICMSISVLCMRNSWRAGIPDKDRTELVTTGIYRFSRNPAFLGFDLQYLGVLLMFGNGLTAGFTVFAAVMLHLQILQEERYLTETFGTPYLEYRKQVFRYLGRR